MDTNRAGSIANICVYCGSSPGDDPRFMDAAIKLGAQMAQAGLGLVYGGGKLGLMGAVAKSVKDNGGRVTGIIPDFLHSRERKFEEADELVTVPDMHTRKRIMFERADAFIALPGGIGTLEELVEQLTWVQLERHDKPVVIADIGGFWRPLISLLAHMRNAQFIRPGLEVRYLVAERIEDCLGMIDEAARRRATLHAPKISVDPRM
ncbi:MAG: TIGR00730 family Rossman fold protein [Alphaproteobacteria bacterium]|nr:TIGR00730 family Rossman fold protein [Alphaproteobacteria bacterium]